MKEYIKSVYKEAQPEGNNSFSDDKLKEILLGSGIGAGLGGAYTWLTPEKGDETSRYLKNMLLGGGAGGGIQALRDSDTWEKFKREVGEMASGEDGPPLSDQVVSGAGDIGKGLVKAYPGITTAGVLGSLGSTGAAPAIAAALGARAGGGYVGRNLLPHPSSKELLREARRDPEVARKIQETTRNMGDNFWDNLSMGGRTVASWFGHPIYEPVF